MRLCRPVTLAIIWIAILLTSACSSKDEPPAEKGKLDSSTPAQSDDASKPKEAQLSKPKPPLKKIEPAPDRPSPTIVKPTRVLWKTGSNGHILAAPVVREGSVFFGSIDGSFDAVDLKDGSVKWSAAPEAGFSASAAVTPEGLYVASHSGKVYALDPKTGKVLWSFPSRYPLAVTPAVWQQSVIQSNGDAQLNSLDGSSGQLSWEFRASRGLTSAIVDKGMIFFGTRDHMVYAVDAKTGVQRWAVGTSGAVTATPIISSQVLFVGTWDGVLYALDLDSGETLWSRHVGSRILALAADGGRSLVATVEDGILRAVDVSNGDLLWTAEVEAVSAATVVGANVLVAEKGGNIVLFREGTEAWRFELDVHPSTGPVISGNTILLGTLDQGLVAVE